MQAKNINIGFLILLFVLLASWNVCHAQGKASKQKTDPPTIVYDHQTGKFIDLELEEKKIKDGGFYTVEVRSVNQNLFKVIVNERDSSVTNAITMPSFSSLDLSGISGVLDLVGDGILTLVQLPKLIDEVPYELLTADAGGYPANYYLYNSTGQQKINKRLASLSVSDSQKRIFNRLLIEMDTLRILRDQLFQLGINYDQIFIDFISAKSPFFDNITLPSRKIDYNQALDSLSKIYEDLGKLNALKSQYRTWFVQDITFDLPSLVNDTTTQKLFKIRQDIEKAYDEFDKSIASFKKQLSPSAIDSMTQQLLLINNRSDCIYQSMPFRFDNDREIVKIKIEPYQKGLYPTYETEFLINYQTEKYTSIGPSFFLSSLHDMDYFVQQEVGDNTDTTYTIGFEGRSGSELGISTLLRLGKKTDSMDEFGYHFSIGPGITISDRVRPRILLGGGISIGKKQKLSIDGGLILGPVARRKRAFSDETDYSAPPSSITKQVNKIGFFLSTGYTIGI